MSQSQEPSPNNSPVISVQMQQERRGLLRWSLRHPKTVAAAGAAVVAGAVFTGLSPFSVKDKSRTEVQTHLDITKITKELTGCYALINSDIGIKGHHRHRDTYGIAGFNIGTITWSTSTTTYSAKGDNELCVRGSQIHIDPVKNGPLGITVDSFYINRPRVIHDGTDKANTGVPLLDLVYYSPEKDVTKLEAVGQKLVELSGCSDKGLQTAHDGFHDYADGLMKTFNAGFHFTGVEITYGHQVRLNDGEPVGRINQFLKTNKLDIGKNLDIDASQVTCSPSMLLNGVPVTHLAPPTQPPQAAGRN